MPLKHFGLAACGLLGFAGALFIGRARLMGFELDARFALGTTHLLTLGCVTTTILGVMTQMIPGHGGTPLRFARAVAVAFWLLCAGLFAFVGALWLGVEDYWIPAASMALALSLYLTSLLATLAAGSRDVTARHFICALCALALVGMLGASLAFDRQRGLLFTDGEGALIAHVHLALVGFVSMAILGGSYRLFYPMTLSRAASRAPSRAAAVLTILGVVGLSVDQIWLGRRWIALWACLLTAAYAAFALQLRALRTTRAQTDMPSAYALLGMCGGLLWCTLGLGLAFGVIVDRWEARAAYVLTALLGWALPWILGQTYKIMPFLAWRAVYQDLEGAPRYDELLLRRVVWIPFYSLLGGVPLLCAGFLTENQAWLTTGAALVLLAAVAHAVQVLNLLSIVMTRVEPSPQHVRA